jgi:putative sigma-54 modulation protein
MNIKIQSIRFDADKKLLDYVDNKLTKLSQIADNITGADVILRLENDENNENKIVEIKVSIPHSPDFFAKKQCKTFEESVDLTTVALRRQIKKFKEKQRS